MYNHQNIFFGFIVDRNKSEEFMKLMSDKFHEMKITASEFNSRGRTIIGEPGDYINIKMAYESHEIFKDDFDEQASENEFVKRAMESSKPLIEIIKEVIPQPRMVNFEVVFGRGRTAEEKIREHQAKIIKDVKDAFVEIRKHLAFPIRRREHWSVSGVWYYETFGRML